MVINSKLEKKKTENNKKGQLNQSKIEMLGSGPYSDSQ